MDGPLFLWLPVLAMPSAWLDSSHSALEPGFVPKRNDKPVFVSKGKDSSTLYIMQQYQIREMYF